MYSTAEGIIEMHEQRSQLKPGATYIYERSEGVIYAREAGADPATRFEIGRSYEAAIHGPTSEELSEMVSIMQAARTNPTLQDALDRVKMLYKLIEVEKDYVPMWHPV